jgi:hypothetical protein
MDACGKLLQRREERETGKAARRAFAKPGLTHENKELLISSRTRLGLASKEKAPESQRLGQQSTIFSTDLSREWPFVAIPSGKPLRDYP